MTTAQRDPKETEIVQEERSLSYRIRFWIWKRRRITLTEEPVWQFKLCVYALAVYAFGFYWFPVLGFDGISLVERGREVGGLLTLRTIQWEPGDYTKFPGQLWYLVVVLVAFMAWFGFDVFRRSRWAKWTIYILLAVATLEFLGVMSTILAWPVERVITTIVAKYYVPGGVELHELVWAANPDEETRALLKSLEPHVSVAWGVVTLPIMLLAHGLMWFGLLSPETKRWIREVEFIYPDEKDFDKAKGKS